MKENEELRGVINSGHSRDNAYVIRTVGDDFTPKRFSTWGAKALSGIGHLSDTLMDRAIVLELLRKLSHENVDRLLYAEPGLFLNLTRKLARFADDYREQVKIARPTLPDALNDRQQDNWEPLLAIAACAGEEWLDRANQVALKLSASDQSASISNELLADIQEVFETKNVTKISTADLIGALTEDEEKSWATYNRGKPLSPRQLAKKLKDYSIYSKSVWLGYGKTPKGYELKQFEDAFDRYLSSTPQNLPPCRHESLEASNHADIHIADDKSQNKMLKPAPILEHGGIADRTPPARKSIRI